MRTGQDSSSPAFWPEGTQFATLFLTQEGGYICAAMPGAGAGNDVNRFSAPRSHILTTPDFLLY
jgi:hypothetical protein